MRQNGPLTIGPFCPIIDNEVIIMSDYKAMYLSLFNSVTDAVKILTDAQKKAESMYIESGDEPSSVLRLPEENSENVI